MARTKRGPAPRCRWRRDRQEDLWETACGRTFQFTVDGPHENGYLYCPGCGSQIGLRQRKAGEETC